MKKLVALLLVAAASMTMTACGNSKNDNPIVFDNIQLGMTENQVKAALGVNDSTPPSEAKVFTSLEPNKSGYSSCVYVVNDCEYVCKYKKKGHILVTAVKADYTGDMTIEDCRNNFMSLYNNNNNIYGEPIEEDISAEWNDLSTIGLNGLSTFVAAMWDDGTTYAHIECIGDYTFETYELISELKKNE